MTLVQPGQLAAFLGAAALVTASPGPDNLMVLGMGMSRGRRQGVAFGLGCASGCLSHTALATLGVSAAIAASRWAFGVLEVAGGLYLLWLSVRSFRSRGAAFTRSEMPEAPAEPLRRVFVRGLLANAINPKVILFFLAFLPQFIEPRRGGAAWQTAQLGVIFALQAGVLFGALGLFAGRVGTWLGRTPRAGRWLDRVAGAVFGLIGLRLLFSW